MIKDHSLPVMARQAVWAARRVRSKRTCVACSVYSWRRALTGSMRLARRAGRKLANKAASTRTGIIKPKLDGPGGCIPSTRCSNSRPAAKAASVPAPTPTRINAKATAEHQPEDVAGVRAERHAHDFRHALGGQVCQHTINADACQQQSQAREYAEQQQEEPLPGERIGSERLLLRRRRALW